MKVVNVNDLAGTDRDVEFKEGSSIRPVLEKDGMGFSVHKTMIRKGTLGHWHYKNHLESCYCISGKGILTSLETGERYEITPDVIYLLDKHDNHTFEAITDVVLISIFNPPVKGGETHKIDGSYEI
jgi:L-ectoine synthase